MPLQSGSWTRPNATEMRTCANDCPWPRRSWIEDLVQLMGSAFCCIVQAAWPILPYEFHISI